jgi:hypothetical protein
MPRGVIKALAGFPAARAAVILACATIAGGPTAVLAEEAIPTASSAPGAGAPAMPPFDPDSGPLRLSDHVDGLDFLGPQGPCGGPAFRPDGKPDRTPHGAVWAGVGTHGYREIGGAVCAPIGDRSAVSIAVDAGQLDGWGHHRW